MQQLPWCDTTTGGKPDILIMMKTYYFCKSHPIFTYLTIHLEHGTPLDNPEIFLTSDIGLISTLFLQDKRKLEAIVSKLGSLWRLILSEPARSHGGHRATCHSCSLGYVS